jgi:hypothetical protein
MWQSLATEENPITAENKIIGETNSHRELHVHRAHTIVSGKGQNTGGNGLRSRDSRSQQPIKGDERAMREHSERGFTEIESGMLQNVAEGAIGSSGGRKQRAVDAAKTQLPHKCHVTSRHSAIQAVRERKKGPNSYAKIADKNVMHGQNPCSLKPK